MNIIKAIQQSLIPISKTNPDYSLILKAIGDAEIVMIGEASHGTHEFYHHRAEITKRLIEEKGFTMVAVEADWPDAYRVNRYVQQSKHCKDSDAESALGDFKRFPLWMWRNTVLVDFIRWMADYNLNRDPKKKAAFYGMDLYSFYSSMEAVIQYLEKVNPKDAEVARKRYSYFDRFQGEPQEYGYATRLGLSPSYEREVIQTLFDLRRKGEEYLKGVGGLIDGDELFYATQNAELVKNAEEYYRQMFRGDENTWNLRDAHMVKCVESLLEFHRQKHQLPTQKVVLWAHNSHLGDARATSSRKRQGEWNVGQLIREKFGLHRTFNIGLLTYSGTVTAAHRWDEPAQLFKVRPGMPNSYEELFHQVAIESQQEDFALIMTPNEPSIKANPDLLTALVTPRYERYIGVIYRPDSEKASHYCTSSIVQEYNAIMFFDQTSGVVPLDIPPAWMSNYKRWYGQDVTEVPSLIRKVKVATTKN